MRWQHTHTHTYTELEIKIGTIWFSDFCTFPLPAILDSKRAHTKHIHNLTTSTTSTIYSALILDPGILTQIKTTTKNTNSGIRIWIKNRNRKKIYESKITYKTWTNLIKIVFILLNSICILILSLVMRWIFFRINIKP